MEAGTSGIVDLARADHHIRPAAGRFHQLRASAPGTGGVQSGQQDGVTTVTVSVQPDVPRGTELALPIQVVDGDGRDGKASLTVTVTGSRKPLPTVLDQQIAQGRAGVAGVRRPAHRQYRPGRASA